jgi:3-oxoacyl-[acyl-carrier protein] reductase
VTIDGEKRRVGLTRAMIEAITERIALRRPGTTAEAAGGVMLFCLPESDYVTGQILEVDGGFVN